MWLERETSSGCSFVREQSSSFLSSTFSLILNYFIIIFFLECSFILLKHFLFNFTPRHKLSFPRDLLAQNAAHITCITGVRLLSHTIHISRRQAIF